MSSTEADAPRSAGRPAGLTPDTLAKARRYRDAIEHGATPASIAAAQGVDERSVRRLLALTSSLDSGRPIIPNISAAKPPRPIGRNAMAGRVWTAMHFDYRLIMAPPLARLLWQEMVMAVRENGDGHTLRFSDIGCSATQFAQHFGSSADDLALLIRVGLLVEIEDGIALPTGLGLIRGEKAGHAPRAYQAPDPHHTATIHQMPGTVRSDTVTPPPPYRQEKNPSCEPAADPISCPPGGQEIPISCPPGGLKTPISCPDASRAAFADADALRKENQDSSNSISTSIVAEPADSKSPISSPPVGQEIPSGHDIKSERLPLAETANRLSAMAGRGPIANPKDTGAVHGWLAQGEAAGLTAEALDALICAVIKNKLLVTNEPLSSLKYLTKPVLEAIRASIAVVLNAEPGAATCAAPPPPQDAQPEDTEFLKLFGRIRAVWMLDTMLPAPPTEPRFRAACEAGDGVVARRWPELWEYWDRAGRPGQLRPPPFSDLFTMRDACLADLAGIEAEIVRRGHGPDGHD